MADIDSDSHSFSDHSGRSDENGKSGELYFDVNSSKKTRPNLSQNSSNGALEALMSTPAMAKSPRSTSTGRKSRKDLQGSSWEKLKRRMSKSPARISAPRLGSASPRRTTDLVSKSDHILYSSDNGRRNSSGSIGINMTGRPKGRSSRPAPILLNRPYSPSTTDSPSADSKPQSPPQKAPRSPRSRKKTREKDSDDSPLVIEKPRDRVRRKGQKKNEFMTPNPRSKPMVEMEDVARLTDFYSDAIVKTKRKSRRVSNRKSDLQPEHKKSSDEYSVPEKQKSIESIDSTAFLPDVKKFSDEDDIMSEEEPKLPFTLPFDDDDAPHTPLSVSGRSRGRKSGRKSGRRSKRTSKSPGRLSRKNSAVDLSGFENDIENLQNEVLRLKESKISGDSETSKLMQELRRKAFDARLELQKSQLENRQVRSELRDKTTALNEAQVDILDLEKRLKEKLALMRELNEKVRSADLRADDNKSTASNANNSQKESSSIGGNTNRHEAMVNRYETIINRKDTKIASLERELRRLRKSGGSMMSSRGSESINGKAVEGLQKALKDTQAQNTALNKRYNGQKDRNAILEDEVSHWKSQTLNMEEEIAEVRSQLNYWMAKYEDVVGASDSAKAQLTRDGKPGLTMACSIEDLNIDKVGGSFRTDDGSYDLDAGSYDLEDDGAGIGGLWKKLTTPSKTEKPKLNAGNIAEMRRTAHY